MRPVGAISRIMGFAVAVAAFVATTQVQAAIEQNEAVVRGVRGTANYSTDRGSNWRDLKVGTKLRQNSVIRTAPGASVDLFLGDNGPVVRVTENTTMGIDRLTIDRSGVEKIIETQLDLRSGRILGNVKKLAAASKYEVKTPQGVAGIRGTRYDISADGRVSITEGDAVVVYVVGGRTSTGRVGPNQTIRPPTTAGGEPQVIPIPATDITTINRQIDEAGRRGVTEEAVQEPILTVRPIIEQFPNAGDRAKIEVVETPVQPTVDVD
jgi:hypothetical protein